MQSRFPWSRDCGPGNAVSEIQSRKCSPRSSFRVSVFHCVSFFFFGLNSEIFCGCGCVRDQNRNQVLLNLSPGPWRHQVCFRNSLKIDWKFHYRKKKNSFKIFFSVESMLAILSIHCSFLHYERIDTMGLPYVRMKLMNYNWNDWTRRV